MTEALWAFLLGFWVLAALVAALGKDLLSSVVALSVFGTLLAILFAVLQAPDVALTQGVISSGLVTALFLVAYSQTRGTGEEEIPPPSGRGMRLLALGICLALGLGLGRGIWSLVEGGPRGAEVHYLAEAGRQTGAANVVAAILFDYRGFDTLGEATVIFTTVCGVSLLFAGSRHRRSSRGLSFLVRRGMGLVVPFMLLYGSSIVVFGHLSPGGGFQGGALFAAVTILFCVVYGADFEAARVAPRTREVLESLGGLAFLLVGLAGLVTVGAFLANGSAGFPLGRVGRVLSGGTIPLLNLAVGLKVGAGLSAIFYSLIKSLETEEGGRTR